MTLTYGGADIQQAEIESLQAKLPNYNLGTAKLEILQGFAYLKDNKDTKTDDQTKQLTSLLNDKETQIRNLKAQADTITAENSFGQQIFAELKVQYPQIDSCIIQQAIDHTETDPVKVWVAIIDSKQKIAEADRTRIEEWLKVRVSSEQLRAYFDEAIPVTSK